MSIKNKICLISSDDDFSKRQLRSLDNFEQLNKDLDIIYIKQEHLGGKDFRISLLTKLISDLFYARNKNISPFYKYFYSKYTGFIFKLLNWIIGHRVLYAILHQLSKIKARRLRFIDKEHIQTYDKIILFTGALTDFSREIIYYCLRENKQIYFLSTGWDNLTSKIPLFDHVTYLSPEKGTTLFINKNFPQISTLLFPMTNHDVYKKIDLTSKNISDKIKVLYAEPVKPYQNDLILEKLLSHKNYEINYKVHPAKDSDIKNNNKRINMIYEKGGEIQLSYGNNHNVDFQDIGQLINYHDIIISPVGSFSLEASILHKPVIALAFGGLGFNFYGDIASKATHFQSLIKEYPIYVAYDLHQLNNYLNSLRYLIEIHYQKKLNHIVDRRFFIEAVQQDIF